MTSYAFYLLDKVGSTDFACSRSFETEREHFFYFYRNWTGFISFERVLLFGFVSYLVDAFSLDCDSLGIYKVLVYLKVAVFYRRIFSGAGFFALIGSKSYDAVFSAKGVLVGYILTESDLVDFPIITSL